MPIRLSSGLRDAMVGQYGLTAMLQYGHIRLYGGASQPASADEPPAGILLGRVSTDGLTPTPGSATGGLVLWPDGPGRLKDTGDWLLRATANGVPTWWRFVWNAVDNGEFSDTMPRIDGAVGESLLLPTIAVTAGMTLPIKAFSLTFPNQ